MDTNEEELNEETIQRFENMLKTNKILFFDSEEFEDLILYYLDSGKVNLSKKALKLALEQHPNSLGIKIAQSELLIFEDKLDLAMTLLNEIEELDPENDEVYFQKSTIYSKQGSHKKAIEMLEKAHSFAEDVSEVYMLIGLEYLYLEEFEQSILYFKKCLKENPGDHSALLNVMYCYDILDDTVASMSFLDNFIDKNPYSELAWQQLGKQLYKTKDYESAVNAFDMAIVIDEFFLGAYVEKGKSLEKCKRYEEAIRTYSELLKIEESSAFVYTRIGYCYDQLQMNKQALFYYLKAVHEDPLYERSWVYITDLYIRFNKLDKALHFINKALGIDEQNYTYWRKFALLNKTLGFEEDAELGYRKAIEFGDDLLDTWLNWIDILIRLNEEELALEKINKALVKYGDQSALMYRKAGVLFQRERIEQGESSLKSALHINANEIFILEQKFPNVWDSELVKQIIKNYQS